MREQKSDELLEYYRREREFLLNMGQDYKRRYPKIASRLMLEPDKSGDPHVERLIEAVAFMAGRIQLKLNDEFPELTESLLNVLYPHYLAPVPSLAIARFAFDPQQGKLTSGYHVPKGTTLFSQRVAGSQCRFRTCYPVTVWPVEVASAELGSDENAPEDAQGYWASAELRIGLRCLNKAKLSDLASAESPRVGVDPKGGAGPLRTLRFWLNGELAHPVYEMLFNNVDEVSLCGDAGGKRGRGDTGKLTLPALKTLGRDCIKPVGFGPGEELWPRTPQTFAGYHLLSEYFAFPEKFLFFDVEGVGEAACSASFGEQFELRIRLRDVQRPGSAVPRDLFQLGCAPVINLFNCPAVPLQVTRQKHEYLIKGETYQQSPTEVYSVDEVKITDEFGERVRRIRPFYSYRHAENPEGEAAFWYASRRPSRAEHDGDEYAQGAGASSPPRVRPQAEQHDGTDVYLSLVELDFYPHSIGKETLSARVTCTNGDLPSRLDFGGPGGGFDLEKAGPLARVRCLTSPTRTQRFVRATDATRSPRRAAHWRLISHLALNHLSIVAPDEKGNPRALQEILKLYDNLNTPTTRMQIDGMTRISSHPVTRQLVDRLAEGYVRGVETTIEFAENNYVGSGLYLFASVLERFLGLYASVNSFTQLVANVRQNEGGSKQWRWTPRAGEQPML
jgi:type VI secretion system protein ImpG